MDKYEQLWNALENEEYRREFADDVTTGLAFQIKLLREKNGWTQEHLAQRVRSKQETISQWENPDYGSYTLNTLKGLASAFDVALVVRFAPFSEVVERSSSLTPEQLAPPSFTEEKAGCRAFRRIYHKPKTLAASDFWLDLVAKLTRDDSFGFAFTCPGTSEGILARPKGERQQEESRHALAA